MIHASDRYTEDANGPVRIFRDSGIPLCDPLAALDVSVISRPGSVLSPAAQNFLDGLRHEAAMKGNAYHR